MNFFGQQRNPDWSKKPFDHRSVLSHVESHTTRAAVERAIKLIITTVGTAGYILLHENKPDTASAFALTAAAGAALYTGQFFREMIERQAIDILAQKHRPRLLAILLELQADAPSLAPAIEKVKKELGSS